jgi:hypothetical protein
MKSFISDLVESGAIVWVAISLALFVVSYKLF